MIGRRGGRLALDASGLRMPASTVPHHGLMMVELRVEAEGDARHLLGRLAGEMPSNRHGATCWRAFYERQGRRSRYVSSANCLPRDGTGGRRDNTRAALSSR